jgi:hypothetical protein
MAKESVIRMDGFPLLEDANSVQVAVMHIVHLLGSGKIDNKVAGLLLYAMQTASANMKHVKFESERVTDIVIDQDTLGLTCINGPQWFERDFDEKEEERKELPAKAVKTKSEASRAGNGKRKKPDPLLDTPDMNNSLAGILLQRMGLLSENEKLSVGESQPRVET